MLDVYLLQPDHFKSPSYVSTIAVVLITKLVPSMEVFTEIQFEIKWKAAIFCYSLVPRPCLVFYCLQYERVVEGLEDLLCE